MKAKWVILAVVLLAAAAIAYYSLMPEPVITLETKEIIVDLCLSEAQKFHNYALAVSENNPELCEENYLKPVCLAKISPEPEVCSEQDLLCQAILENNRKCSELGFQRFACEAAVRGDLLYFESEQLQKDCKDLSVLEAALESDNARSCRKVDNAVLSSECKEILG